MNLSAVILAGGESRRMGRDKAWIESDGQPLIVLALDKVRQLGVSEVFISGRADVDYSALKIPVLFDAKPGCGPLGGIESALHICAAPLLLVLAVDMPHMTAGFLRTLAGCCDPLTGVVPERAGRLEPLAAIYPKRCHALAGDLIAKSQLAVRDFVEACARDHMVKIHPVSAAEENYFSNWNSPADVVGQLRTASLGE
jgi:molybdopterin-guanine dinucleotide biosynthesis protein A